jgi:energy-coupling factor transport system permease protein
MASISLGRYVKGDSWLHRCDTRIKIVMLIVYLVALFLIPISPNIVNLISLTSLFAVALLVFFTAKIPFLSILKSIKGIIFLILITAIFQIFSIKGGDLLFEGTMHLSWSAILAILLVLLIYGFTRNIIKFKTIYLIVVFLGIFVLQYYLPYLKLFDYQMVIYSEALLRALFLFIRIIAIILATSLLTYTTMTTDFASALESLLSPLKVIKIPVSIFAMIMSLTLRSIPILYTESETIIKAQASRGSDLKESGLFQKVKQIVSFMIPILVISFQKAFDLADAMEVRGYVVNAPRTSLDKKTIKPSDIVYLLLSFVILTASILVLVLI